MKKLISCSIITSLIIFSSINLNASENLSGNSIKLIDAAINLKVKKDGATYHAPGVFRYCIDGLEVIAIRSGSGSSILQVLDEDGKPKSCR